jgi:hypothetical protein
MKTLLIIVLVLNIINFIFFVLFWIGVGRESRRGNRERDRLIAEWKRKNLEGKEEGPDG